MSVLCTYCSETEPRARVVISMLLRQTRPPTRYFAAVADRLSIVLLRTSLSRIGWREALAQHDITHIVPRRTITPISRRHGARSQESSRGGQSWPLVDVT